MTTNPLAIAEAALEQALALIREARRGSDRAQASVPSLPTERVLISMKDAAYRLRKSLPRTYAISLMEGDPLGRVVDGAGAVMVTLSRVEAYARGEKDKNQNEKFENGEPGAGAPLLLHGNR